jgi:hypothetical protein
MPWCHRYPREQVAKDTATVVVRLSLTVDISPGGVVCVVRTLGSPLCSNLKDAHRGWEDCDWCDALEEGIIGPGQRVAQIDAIRPSQSASNRKTTSAP